MKALQKGFTLIELMIVIAIIGILAAIALPMYQDYISRSQITRVMGEIAGAKTAVDAALFNGEIPGNTDVAGPPRQVGIGLTDTTGLNTRSNLLDPLAATGLTNTWDGTTAVRGTGTIGGLMGGNANADIAGAQVGWSRNAQGEWQCQVIEGGAGWKDKFVPTGCAQVTAWSTTF